jgi:hypothetical protein
LKCEGRYIWPVEVSIFSQEIRRMLAAYVDLKGDGTGQGAGAGGRAKPLHTHITALRNLYVLRLGI